VVHSLHFLAVEWKNVFAVYSYDFQTDLMSAQVPCLTIVHGHIVREEESTLRHSDFSIK
jgi:cytolysin (calcineurin-like family phosphatase)